MDKKDEIIRDLKRVAKELGKTQFSLPEYRSKGKFGRAVIIKSFGSWDRAVKAAGLKSMKGCIPSRAIPEDELLDDLVKITLDLMRAPTRKEMIARGKYSERPYVRRWGSFTKAKEIAFEQAKLQNPDLPPIDTVKPRTGQKLQKRPQFGELLNFRSVQHAPINELGVIYLFAILSKELGFVMEFIGSKFPDCRAKRALDKDQTRWEQVLIEFEYKSSKFRDHGHNPGECNLIVCWEDDWKSCPLEVLELRKIVKSE